jgi:potassium channel subfamily K
LLAVPTLTVLISNMGDTIVKGFKDFTIWVGTFTVLPDEKGLTSALKVGMKRVKAGKMLKERDIDRKGAPRASEQRVLERLTKHIEEEELGRAEEAGEHGDYLERDIRFYHFVLAKEIRHMMTDINSSPPRQYTYDEWTYFLRLIGQDEGDASSHRRPEDQLQHKKGDAPDIGTADDGDTVAWSWLGIRSPLMGNTNEPEWLLHRLTAKLEAEMRKMSSPDEKKRKEKPPISMAELGRKSTDETSQGSETMRKDVAADVKHQERKAS